MYYPRIGQFKTALTALMKEGVEFPGCAKQKNLKSTEKWLLEKLVPDDCPIFKDHARPDPR